MNFEFDQFHTEQASALLRAMGNPQRLRILLLLAERERSVIELEALVGLSQSAVSQHLARLRQAKLVRFRRDGQMTFYALDGAEVQSILMTLHLLYGRDKSRCRHPSLPHRVGWRPIRPIDFTGSRIVAATQSRSPAASRTSFSGSLSVKQLPWT